MNNQKGYTLVELLVCVFGLVTLGIFSTLVYVGFHFLAKFW